ncbi:MAG: hypothetical protein ACRDOO_02780 [Actinomadura sp.]
MSGYGGQPPGWQDPYGQSGWDPQGQYAHQQGWQDPYAQQGYGYGPPGVPQSQASNGSAIAALICNIVLFMFCASILALPGIVTAAVAMGRVQTDPHSARRLTMWSWALFAVVIVLGIVIIGLLIAFGVFTEMQGQETDSTF